MRQGRPVPVLVCVEVFPLQMEGVRLMVNKGLTNYFQVRDRVHGGILGVVSITQTPLYASCSPPGESHCALEHRGRFQLQVWYDLRGLKADGSL